MEYHRGDYKRYTKGLTDKTITSFKIFDKYGIENCDIILIELVNATCKEELHQREAYYIKSMLCVNKMVPLRTKKEYRDDTKEQIKKYYQDNKEHFKEKIICDCGSIVSRTHISRHNKTIKHQEYLKLKLEDIN